MLPEIATAWRELTMAVAKEGFQRLEVRRVIEALESLLGSLDSAELTIEELWRLDGVLASLLPSVQQWKSRGIHGGEGVGSELDEPTICFLAAQSELVEEEMKRKVVEAAIAAVSKRGLEFVNVLKYQTVADWFFAGICKDWMGPRSTLDFHTLIYGLIAANPARRVDFFNIQRDNLLRIYSDNPAGGFVDPGYSDGDAVKTLVNYIEYRGEDATEDEVKLVVDVLNSLFNCGGETHAHEYSGPLINCLGVKAVPFYPKLLAFYIHEFDNVDVATIAKILKLGGESAAEKIFDSVSDDCGVFGWEPSADKYLGICVLLKNSGFIDEDVLDEYLLSAFDEAIEKKQAKTCLRLFQKLRDIDGPASEEFVEQIFLRVYEAAAMDPKPDLIARAIDGLSALVRRNPHDSDTISDILKDMIKGAKSAPLTSAEVQFLCAFSDFVKIPKSLAAPLEKFVNRRKKLATVDLLSAFNLSQFVDIEWPEDCTSDLLEQLKAICELKNNPGDPRWTSVMAAIERGSDGLPWFLIGPSARIVMETFAGTRNFLAVRLWLFSRQQAENYCSVAEEFLNVDLAKSLLAH